MGNAGDIRRELSGDARIDGDVRTPVELREPEDVYVSADAVDGTLTIVDPEYVFTDVVPADDGDDPAGTAESGSAATVYTGEIEDGYLERVGGDATIRGAEDVFVEHAAADRVRVVGAENRFHDDTAAPTRSPDAYEVRVSGWEQSRSVRDPRDGVSVTGRRNRVTVSDARGDLTVYVAGAENEVRIEGQAIDVTVFVVGYENTVSVGPYVSATIGSESGYDNEIDSDPLPPEALVERSRADAFDGATVGRHKLTYQQAADSREWCPNCGETAEAVIVRKQLDAFFLFGHPIRTYDDGGESFECEHCTPLAIGPTDLSPDERRRVLR